MAVDSPDSSASKESPAVFAGKIDRIGKVLSGVYYRKFRYKDIDRIYHYTNSEGFIGIIDNDEIWFTHINYFNDFSEASYFRSVIDEALDELGEEGHGPEVSLFIDSCREGIDARGVVFDVYAACFCERRDDLPLWRAYAQAGGGYVMCFDLNAIVAKFNAEPKARNLTVCQINYNRQQQVAFLKSCFVPYVKLFERNLSWLEKESHEDVYTLIKLSLSNALVIPSLSFKNPAFAYEKEWRLVRIVFAEDDKPQISFRSGFRTIVPYLRIGAKDLVAHASGRLPINEVIQGPTLDAAISGKAVREYLAARGYAVTVQSSNVPIRF
jgi:hypothetical protein